MSIETSRTTFPATEFKVTGKYLTTDNSCGISSIYPNSASTATLRFELKRSTETSRGEKVNSLTIPYTISGAALTSFTVSLDIIQYTLAGETVTSVPVTLAGFGLTLGDWVGTLTVNTPAYDTSTDSHLYKLILTLANSGAAISQVKFCAIEILHSSQLISSTADIRVNTFNLNDLTTPAFQLQLEADSNPATTVDHTLTFDVSNADRTIDLAGNLTLANDLSTAGNFSLTLTQTAGTNVILPVTGTLVTLSGAETLANKTVDATGMFGATPSSFVPLVYNANQQDLTGAGGIGVISVTTYYTALTITAANTFSLADSTMTGMLKLIKVVDFTGPGNAAILFDNLEGGTFITTAANLEATILLLWNGTKWRMIESINATLQL